MKYIELSHKISKRTITYPTDPDFEINVEKTRIRIIHCFIHLKWVRIQALIWMHHHT